MNGAESLLRAAVSCGVEVLFSNPGTTELPLVVALDAASGLRPVLALFEGVATGAADGYGRMAGKPALTLMHLGPGLGNGLANLHNARRARTPVVNIVGDHPAAHRRLDPPLVSDIAAIAGAVSTWVRSTASAADAARDLADAVHEASWGRVATLIVPANCLWEETTSNAAHRPGRARTFDGARIDSAAAALRGGAAALLLGGRGLSSRAQRAAARVQSGTGCRLFSELFPARQEHGDGLPLLERVPYLPRLASAAFGGLRSLVLAGAERPVAFFAEQGASNPFVPEHVDVRVLASPDEDVQGALESLADGLDARIVTGQPARPKPAGVSNGPLTTASLVATMASMQPEGLILVDEGVSSAGAHLRAATGCPPFTYLALTGGATGQGLPCATGAAIACPDRPVLALVGDGAALYTLQSLWTQAREGLHVITVVLANDRYRMLDVEMARAGTPPGPRAESLTSLSSPPIDWVQLAQGFGVPGTCVDTTDGLGRALARSLSEPGPHLIQARMAAS